MSDTAPTTTALAAPVNYGPVQLDRQKLALIGNTIAPDLTPNELALFGEVCMRKQLDPFSGQIHAIKRYVKKNVNGQWTKEARVTFQTSQEGFLSLAERTAEYDGMDPPVYGPLCSCGEVKARGEWDDDSGERAAEKLVPHPEFATVTVYRRGFTRPISATSYWHEYYPGAKQGAMWHKMPRIMLAKVARVAALRLAFPYVMGGLYSDDEMQQSDREPAQVNTAPAQVLGPAPASPGVPDQATVGTTIPTDAAIQPAPPAAPVEAQPATASAGAGAAPPPPPTSPPDRSARSVGPKAKRTHVVDGRPQDIPTGQAPTMPATPVPDASASVARAAVVADAPAPAAPVQQAPQPVSLVDEEPVPTAAAQDDEEGKRIYLDNLRNETRKGAGVLHLLRVKLKNQKAALAGQPLLPEPGVAPNADSDESLRLFVDSNYPSRTLADLRQGELENVLGVIEGLIDKIHQSGVKE
jgi:phage recombination protein Bet